MGHATARGSAFTANAALLICAWFATFSSNTADADSVHLRDGSVIVGTVKSIGDGKIVFTTGFAGDISIPLKEVTGLETAEALDVTVAGGGHYVGRLSVDEESKQQVVQDGESAEIDISDLVEATLVPADASEKVPADWSGRVELSLHGDMGNTDKLNAKLGFSTVREAALDRLTLTLRAEYEESDGGTTTSEAYGGTFYERDVSERKFLFTRFELEYDQFEQVDLRSRLAVGMGYFLIRNPRQDLKIFGGVGGERERFSDGTREWTPLVGGGYDYRLDVRSWLLLKSSLVSYVNPTELDDFRLNADNSAELPLSNRSNWKLRLGVRNEYDSEPLPGVEQLDTTYYLSLVYAWD